MRLHHIIEPELLLIRAKNGVDIDLGAEFWGDHAPDGDIFSIFFLISPEENPKQHLRLLAKIADRVDAEEFISSWMSAKNEQEIKELLLRDDTFFNIKLKRGTKSEQLIGKALKDIVMPEESLIAIINRGGRTIVPRGHKELKDRDRLTIIGDAKGIKEFRRLYGV